MWEEREEKELVMHYPKYPGVFLSLGDFAYLFIFCNIFYSGQFFFFLIFTFWSHHTARGVLAPTRDRTHAPLQWKHGVLTTALPGKSLFRTNFRENHNNIPFFIIGLGIFFLFSLSSI